MIRRWFTAWAEGADSITAYSEFNVGNGERMMENLMNLGRDGWYYDSFRKNETVGADHAIIVKLRRRTTAIEAFKNGWSVNA